MNNNRALGISLGVAAFAVLFVNNYVTSTIESARREIGEQRSVVVAKRDIRELETLDETNLELRAVPANFAQPGTAGKTEELRGALAIAPIAKGEQVTRTKITVAGPRPGLARQVASGKRAVTMRINDENGVARLLKPGDRVDVVATIDPSDSGRKAFFETHVILQDVTVPATGKYVTNNLPGIYELDSFRTSTTRRGNPVPLAEYTNYATVTLEVAAAELTKAVFAVQNFNLYLALRNNDDIGAREETFTKTMLRDFLPGSLAGAPAAAPAPAGPPAKK